MVSVDEGAPGTTPAGAASPYGSAAAGATTDDGKEGEIDESGVVHGSFGLRFVERTTGGTHDTDIYGLLETSIGDAAKDEVTGYVLARAAWDLDKNSNQDLYGGLEDTYSNSVHSNLYEAYADFHENGFSLLRIGRQQLDDTPEYVRFDGVAIETAPDGSARQQYGAYLGQSDYEYESSSSGNKVVGGYFKVRPWEGGKLRLDALHIENGVQQGESQLGSENNDLYAARLGQQFGKEVHVEGAYSVLEEKPRDLDLRATWVRPESGWLVNFWYHELLRTQEFLVEEFDPYYATLTQYEPFRQARVLASKSFEAGYDVTAGLDGRKLKNSDDEGDFNHEFTRYFLTETTHDFVTKDLDFSVTGELWDGNDNTEYATWGVDLTRKWTKAVRMSLGSFYALYKNDFLLNEDRQDVRDYYLTMRYLVDKTLTWSLGIDHEVSDVDNFDTLTAKATWRF